MVRSDPTYPPLISLTTDFGASFYVGQMKGVLARLAPLARVVDLTHEIEPQSIAHGAIVLQDSIPWFPEGSIHIAVVDPGVGTDRRLVAVDFDGRVVIGPDNGLLSALAEDIPPRKIVSLNQPQFWAANPSTTFHGRDIMAPVAAHLAKGGAMDSLGPPLRELHPSPLPPVISSNGIDGVTCVADRFGNLLTNVRIRDLRHLDAGPPFGKYRVKLTHPNHPAGLVLPIVSTYGDAKPGELVALMGSAERLEISIANGNARERLGEGSFPIRISQKDANGH